MEIIIEILDKFLFGHNIPNLQKGGLGPLAIAAVGAGVRLIGGLIGAKSAKKQAREAEREKIRLDRKITSLENTRQPISNPYSDIANVSGIATDLSGLISNPYENLGVATQAAAIQIEQADIALANTLDTLRATGTSAGGATALAQAALQSKRGVSASIEQQEAQNEKLRAQGESQMQQMQMSEQQRLQGIQMSEAQRVQQAQAAGKEFTFRATEERELQQLDRTQAQQDQARAQIAQSQQNKAGAVSGALSGIGNIATAAIGIPKLSS